MPELLSKDLEKLLEKTDVRFEPGSEPVDPMIALRRSDIVDILRRVLELEKIPMIEVRSRSAFAFLEEPDFAPKLRVRLARTPSGTPILPADSAPPGVVYE